MSLTKQDLQQIKNIVHGEVSGVSGEIIGVRNEIERVHGSILGELKMSENTAQAQFDRIDKQLASISDDVVVIKDFVKDHSFRIARLEHKRA
jgi:hypothetical protein